ncbi:MAG: serine/threonine protein kinase [Paramuribaculum sp.]|nr:serine/threonine protein kinase [Paramuribaculum sp.]
MDERFSEFFSEIDFDHILGFSEITLIYDSVGGFTQVYRARKDLRKVAIKCIKERYREDPVYNSLLRKEYELGIQFDHSGILRFYSFEKIEGMGMCIVSEFIEGETLADRLKRGKLDEKEAMKILKELCEAVDYLHRRQTVHFDLKPDNIMLTFNGGHVKLLDFGFADADSFAVLKRLGGTAGYCAPEQIAKGEENPDFKSDIYAIGKIMKEMVSRPSYGFRKISDECISKNRQKRPSNAIKILSNTQLYNKNKIALTATIGVFIAVLIIGVLWMNYDDPKNEELKSIGEELPAATGSDTVTDVDSVKQAVINNREETILQSPRADQNIVTETSEPSVEKTEMRNSIHPLEIICYNSVLRDARILFKNATSPKDTVNWREKVSRSVNEWVMTQVSSKDTLLLSLLQKRIETTIHDLSLKKELKKELEQLYSSSPE